MILIGIQGEKHYYIRTVEIHRHIAPFTYNRVLLMYTNGLLTRLCVIYKSALTQDANVYHTETIIEAQLCFCGRDNI